MRLNKKRQNGILAAFAESLEPKLWQEKNVILLLYGSRADDSLKGGDIDLLLLVTSSALAAIKLKRNYILTAIERNIGECRVDLLIAPMEPENQSEFVTSIIPKAIELFPAGSDNAQCS